MTQIAILEGEIFTSNIRTRFFHKKSINNMRFNSCFLYIIAPVRIKHRKYRVLSRVKQIHENWENIRLRQWWYITFFHWEVFLRGNSDAASSIARSAFRIEGSHYPRSISSRFM